jgi:hypothetical protein
LKGEGIVNRVATLFFMIGCAVGATAAAAGYSLSIEEELERPPVDPRTEARLAQWNSPIGRVVHNMHDQQAFLLRGGQPGAGSGGLAMRFKIQRALPLTLVATTTDANVDFYERSVVVIHWPWKDDEKPVLTLDEQLSLLLGNRLGSRRPAGSSD